MISTKDGKKAVLTLLILFVMSFWLPSAFAVTSTQECLDNVTLREYNHYNFQITENVTDNINLTQYKDTQCEFRCQNLTNGTAECSPKPFDITLMFVGGMIVLFVAVLFIIGWAKIR
jgi:hypothetical protein